MNIEITGKVLHGNGYGKKLGFPTANIDRRSFGRNKISIKEGVYSGFVRHEKNQKMYRAGIVIGPKDKKGLLKLEAHLMDFKGDLYGELLTFFLKKFLHPFKKYKNEEELKQGILKDLQKAKRVI